MATGEHKNFRGDIRAACNRVYGGGGASCLLAHVS